MRTKTRSTKPRAPRKSTSAGRRVDPDLLALWTSRFALLFESGVTLLRMLSILEQEAVDPALARVTRDLREKVETGEHLSRIMGGHPDIFSPFYISMVRAGEVGGVLEVTMERLAELLSARVVQRAGRQRLDRRALVDWFWTFGTLLKSRVPVLQAMETIAESAPAGLRRATLEMRDALRQGILMEDSMARYPGLFGLMTSTLVGCGEGEGRLDHVLLDLARWHEQLLPLEAAGKLPRLTAKPLKTPPVGTGSAAASSNTVRRVNEILQEALDLDAEAIELWPTANDRGLLAIIAAGRRVKETALDGFGSIVRRIKIMADISHYARASTQGRALLRYKGDEREALVNTGGGGLQVRITLKPRPPESAPVELSAQKPRRARKRKP